VKTITLIAVAVVLVLGFSLFYVAPYEHTHGSPSRLGNTTGKLMDNDHLGKICDRTPNGVKDRQTVFRGYGVSRHVANETYDKNGTRPGCSYERYNRNMSAHQVSSLRGGTFSVH
jgi:hypothetical protein